MNSEDKSQDTQEQLDNSNAPETADKKEVDRLADELAGRAKKRELDYDEGHDIFTK